MAILTLQAIALRSVPDSRSITKYFAPASRTRPSSASGEARGWGGLGPGAWWWRRVTLLGAGARAVPGGALRREFIKRQPAPPVPWHEVTNIGNTTLQFLNVEKKYRPAPSVSQTVCPSKARWAALTSATDDGVAAPILLLELSQQPLRFLLR